MIIQNQKSMPISFFTSDTRSAPLWLAIRLYVGWTWVSAGWEKVLNPAWFGSDAGAALTGFIQGAIEKASGAHPAVQGWYAAFLNGAVLPHIVSWSNAIALGELLVGLGLIVGLFTGTAAFFGALMSLDFLLAGTVSVNPIMLVLEIMIIAGRAVAGYWGLDYFARPLLRRIMSPTPTIETPT